MGEVYVQPWSECQLAVYLVRTPLVAREMGVPAVVNTGVATPVIRDGQLLEVDGTRGLARLL